MRLWQVEYDSRYGVKADVWSLGVVLHVMLTCKFPKTQLNQAAIIDESIKGEGEYFSYLGLWFLC